MEFVSTTCSHSWHCVHVPFPAVCGDGGHNGPGLRASPRYYSLTCSSLVWTRARVFARAVLTEAANSLSFIDAVHTRIQPDVRPGTVAFATLRSVRHICNSARCFLLLVDARRIPRIRRVGALRKRFPAPSQVPSRVQDMV